ncbi:MAG: glycoside hydrolase family 2 TIM barrel-domain containing protein [Oscillospiraceae bacterium]
MNRENFNQQWLFCKSEYDSKKANNDFTKVNLPHANELLDLNYFDDEQYKYECFYKKVFKVTSEDLKLRHFIEFDGVMAYAKVYLNGEFLADHKGGYTRFTIELTKSIVEGENEIIVVANSEELATIPPFGNAIDYLTFGGIYRDVTYIKTSDNYISDITLIPASVLEEEKKLDIKITINANLNDNAEILVNLYKKGNEEKVIATKKIETAIKIGENEVTISLESLKGIELWDIESPNLYTVSVLYSSESCTCLDSADTGFRTATFTDHGFFLNGKKVKLMGLNRHQSFPVVGYAMPKRVQEKDADILKHELGLNLVRTSHYPQSRHFLNRCDEIGLLVFEEIPGWQHIGDEKWQEVSLQNEFEMITADKNHPSIILWGVRINESIDNHNFYTKTNALAHKLDKTRQTGGVRCLDNSELLEDVYTMNDFVHDGTNELHKPQQKITGLDTTVPYMITEFAGHMYPTKAYDNEERVNEQMRRHLDIQNDVGIDDEVCGGIGWCAFDYHTHNNFGSGDRICYHGVCDVFRLPKFAGLFYKSQRDPKYGYVLEPSTRWTVGERDGCGISPLTVLTNCDYIKVFLSDKEFGTFYPNREKYQGLKYPPCIIDDFNVVWGGGWGTGKFVGYKDDKEVIVKNFTNNSTPTTLSVKADDKELIADGSDTTRVVVRALDSADNILHFFMSPIEIEITGDGELIGDNLVSFQGGVYAFWVKTTTKAGEIKIKVSSPKFKNQTINIKTERV